MPMPTRTSMDAARTVVVTAYEELPRRRSGSYSASWSTARAGARAAAGGYNRRAMLLAYAQHLRRRGGQRSSSSSLGPPRALEWGEWKRADDPGAGAGNDDKVVAGRRRGCCSRLRLWARLWIRTFFRRVRRIKENASCRKAD